MSLGNIIRKIENDDKIPNEFKDDFIDAYNNILNKTRIQFQYKYYREYVMEPVERYYIEKNIDADDEKSIIRDDDQLIPESSDIEDKEDKTLKDKLKSNFGKTIVRSLSGEGLHFNRIKIDENLLKKIFYKLDILIQIEKLIINF